MTLAGKSKRCALYTHWNIRPIEAKIHGFRPGRRVSITETEKKQSFEYSRPGRQATRREGVIMYIRITQDTQIEGSPDGIKHKLLHETS